MTEIAIHIENLIRDFGPVRALDNLSLEVLTGIIFGFLGHHAPWLQRLERAAPGQVLLPIYQRKASQSNRLVF